MIKFIAVKLNYLSWPMSPNSACLSLVVHKLYRYTLRLHSSLHMYLVHEVSNWLVEYLSTQTQQFSLNYHAVFSKLGSIYACKYAEGGHGHVYTPSNLGAA